LEPSSIIVLTTYILLQYIDFDSLDTIGDIKDIWVTKILEVKLHIKKCSICSFLL